MTTKKPVRVEYSRPGFRDLIACGRWWREHHSSRSNALDDEFEAAIAFLKLNPEGAPQTQTRRYNDARSKVLLETGHVVIYRYLKSTRVILILGVFPSKAMPQRP